MLPCLHQCSYSEYLDTRLAQDELGYSLRYPTYKEGLTAQKDEEDRAAQMQSAPSRMAGKDHVREKMESL
jgi:hypothetical protein